MEVPGFKLTGDFLQFSGFTVRFFESALKDESFYGIEILGSHFIIEDNRFIETLDAGVFTTPRSSGGIIRRNFFYHNVLVSIEVHGAQRLVEANTIRQSIQDHPTGRKTDDADAIRFFGTGHIFRGAEEGDLELTTDILIENNFCEASSYQTDDTFERGIIIRNNIFGSLGIPVINPSEYTEFTESTEKNRF